MAIQALARLQLHPRPHVHSHMIDNAMLCLISPKILFLTLMSFGMILSDLL